MHSNAPSCRQCRQAGQKLFLKGAKCRTAKCPEDKRSITPGQHAKDPSKRKLSEFGKQMLEKQKVKRMYGVDERQFRRFFDFASRQKGVRGENLLSILERRLDNVVFRLKMSLSRVQARQMIVHGHIMVNGEKVKTPSFLVHINDIISLSEKTEKKSTFVKDVVDKRINIGVKVPDWLELQKTERKGVVLRLPMRPDITADIEEHLIVELYSK